ncbi:MAG TPA: diguanylate cyclase [Solirubrobacterales bacterium]|nr:diguanylate cyclase [Solirubrobacterales bacterium]
MLFAAVFLARVTVGTLADAISFLYVIPVVLVAISIGTRGGLFAGVIAFALSSASTLLVDAPSSALGYANRGLVFLFVGGLTGHFATSLRTLEMASGRHFELSQDMICTADFNGYFTRVNPAFERTLGYSEEDLLGRPFLDFVHPDDRERTEEEAAALAQGTNTIHFQNRYFDKEGEVHWLEWMSQPVPEEGTIYAVARDITERKALERELERLSQHDALTGLFNRRRFEEELRRQLAYTRRYGKGGALLLIDIDRFKEINDTLGHAAGDKALCWVASALRDNLRATDVVARDADPIVARFGGDEFVVLLPEVDEDEARAVADRLAAVLHESALAIEGRLVRLQISIGVAAFDEYGRPGEQELVAAADRAMYEAKAAGRLL